MSRPGRSLYNPARGRVPERLKGTRCKRVGLRLRWFESIPVHHPASETREISAQLLRLTEVRHEDGFEPHGWCSRNDPGKFGMHRDRGRHRLPSPVSIRIMRDQLLAAAGVLIFFACIARIILTDKISRHRDRPQSSSASRRTAGASGFLYLEPAARPAARIARAAPLAHDALEPEPCTRGGGAQRTIKPNSAAVR